MRFTATTLVAAAMLACAAPALAAPQPLKAGFDVEVGAQLGPIAVEAEVGAAVDLELCRNKADIAVGGKLALGCSLHTPDFRKRMDTAAHQRYEVALEIYHDTTYLIRHTLMTRGLERLKRLIQISALIHEGLEILIKADGYNSFDKHTVRRTWISFEISHLRGKFERAQWIARHLPNLCLAEDIYHFAVDASIAVVEFAVAVPVVIGAGIVVAIGEAAHLVARAFHYMRVALNWTIEAIEHAFLVFKKKVKAAIKAAGKFIGKVGHAVVEGVEDGIAVIVDIGHHLFQGHKCHEHCSVSTGIVVVGEDKCDCKAEAEFATVTEVCENVEVCSTQEYTETITEKYDVSLSWTKETSHTEVRKTFQEVNAVVTNFSADLVALESDRRAQF